MTTKTEAKQGQKRMDAAQWINTGMQACLPPGCPLPWSAVESARFVKKETAQAQVRLVDGTLGTVQISQVPCAGHYRSWCIAWQELPGGALAWNGECWERVASLAQALQVEIGRDVKGAPHE